MLLPAGCDDDALLGGSDPFLFDTTVEATADRAWLKLKQFSLLTVREMHGERTGVLHRLLGQSLRAHLAPDAAVRILSSCVWAVERHWAFDPADPSTWSGASDCAVDNIFWI